MDITGNTAFTKEINRLNMNISEAVYSVLNRNWNYHLCSSFTRVYMVTKGEGWLRTAEQTVRLTPGNIYLVPAGLAFDTECPVSMEKLYFHINILRYNRYDLFDGHPRIITLADCMPQIEACVADYQKGDMNAVFSIKQRLWQTVERAVRQENIRWGGIEVYSQPVKSVIGRIENVVQAAADGHGSVVLLGVEELSSYVNLSVSALQKTFRAEVGIPLRRYINDRILITAERELRVGHKPIARISESLGFCDQFYFSRCFCARYGLSPRDYRKNRT